MEGRTRAQDLTKCFMLAPDFACRMKKIECKLLGEKLILLFIQVLFWVLEERTCLRSHPTTALSSCTHSSQDLKLRQLWRDQSAKALFYSWNAHRCRQLTSSDSEITGCFSTVTSPHVHCPAVARPPGTWTGAKAGRSHKPQQHGGKQGIGSESPGSEPAPGRAVLCSGHLLYRPLYSPLV